MTRRPSGTAWTGWRVLVALVVVVGGLQLVPVAASAAPVAGTLTATPDPPTVSEQVELTGSLPPARPRPVTLERRTGTGAWTQVGSGRTAADGSVEFDVTMPGAVGATVSYRVQAAEVRRDGTVLPAVQTPDVVLTTVAQSATLVLPASVAAGSSFEAVADFSPDRPGRQVVLQRRSGNRWQTSATSTQDASGTVRFVVPAGSDTGPQTFRAVAKKDAGAPRVISPSATVNVTTEEDTTPPAVPAGLAAVPGDSAAALSWDEVGDADLTGYRVHRAPAATGPWTLAASPTGTTHEELGLTNGTTYWFAVSAVDADGNESARSAAAFVTPVDSTAPAAPSGLAATAGDGSVSLAWDEVADATGYVVAQGPSADGPWTTAGSPSEESLEVLGLTNGTPYWFTVAAVDAAGNDSAPSAPVSATPVDQTPPPAVTLLSATPHDRSVVLVWEESSAVDLASYRIEWAGAADGPFTTAVPSITDTTYTFTGLTNGTTRWYRVVGVDAAGNASAPSEALGATPFDDAAPGVPAPVSVIAHDRGVELSWGGQYGGDTAGFNVWTSSSAEGPWTLVDGSPFASPPLTIDGLTNGTTYWFSVSSLDTSGNESERSEAASATPFDNAPPPTPTGVTAVASPGKVTVSWDAVVDEALVDYVVLRGASATGPWERYDYTTSTATAYEDANVVPGATYWYTVQSVDAAGNWSAPSAAVEAVAADTTPPAVPTGLAATAGDAEVRLTWDAVLDADLHGYRVHLAEAEDGPWTAAGELSDTTTSIVSALMNDSEYWFSVSASDTWGNESARSVAVSATPAFTPPVAASLSAGYGHSCHISADASLWCWGLGQQGQLGLGTITSTSVPARVPGDAAWVAVSTGTLHTCAIRSDRTLWCWGENAFGALGTGDNTSRTSPTRVGEDSDWLTVSAGSSHNCGLRTNGYAWCWGSNNNGQLGDGTEQNRTAPVQVDGRWASVSADGGSTCGIRVGATAWCWGYVAVTVDDFGNVQEARTPQPVPGDQAWSSIAAGANHVCGIQAAGTLWCWGDNSRGQLGNGSFSFSPSPTPQQVGDRDDWTSVTTGSLHTCGTRAALSAWCWGYNQLGSLGDGTTSNAALPVQVPGTWSVVDAGSVHTCGVSGTDLVRCWGQSSYGQLGNGRSETEPTPMVISQPSAVIDSAPGSTRTCAVSSAREMWCWGSAIGGGGYYFGQAATGIAWAKVDTDTGHVCGVDTTDRLWCWGNNNNGQVGDGTGIFRYGPVVVAPGTAWRDVSVSQQHTCGVRTDGTAWCWGQNSSGVLGDGSYSDRLAPTQVGSSTDWVDISTSLYHSCGLRTGGEIYCWGAGSGGLLGTGGNASSTTPVAVVGEGYVALSTGRTHSCGIRADGSAWCWGGNFSGQLGNGSYETAWAPTQVGDRSDWLDIDAGDGDHTCGVTAPGTAWCWGANESGQAGTGAISPPRSTPQALAGNDWASTSVAWATTCGVRSDGSMACWGRNGSGQAGRPPYETSPVPVLL